jgi:two-component system phosphate regulon sensor histidine kinase PhoR
VSNELDRVAVQFEELRSRLTEVAGDDPVLAELLAALQEAVAHEAEVVEAILDQLPVGVTALDPALRVVRFNQRAREITGQMVTTDTPLCDWPVELFDLDGTPMDLDERPSIRALHGEAVRNVVFELRDGERPPYLLNASSTPIRDATGEVTLAVSVFEDVTEGRRRQLADREFVANAAHQIRAPIAGIVSSVGALNAGAKDEPAARDRFLGHIEREVARLQQLAAGLLSLARAERGETPAPLSMIPLKPLLQRVIELSPPKDGVDLVLSCPERLTALTNEALMSEAVANVVTNAVQHTTRGTVALRGGPLNGGVCIEISDNGPGVHGLDRDRIFERFFRGSRQAGTGVGLGLAIAAAATHAAGGMLEFVDSPVGACFRFTFGGALLA